MPKKPKALEELQNNAIWKSITAAKDNKVFVNSVDPLLKAVQLGVKQHF
jgi:iron complex transport system substrate-binding protein